MPLSASITLTDRPINRQLHYRFLCRMLTDPSPEQLGTYLGDPRWNWEVLLKVASDELILPSLYDRLSHLPGLDPDVLEVLKKIRELNRERNQLILNELRTACRLANQVGVEPVVLKGTAHLLSNCYPTASDRYLADIDLLMPEPLIKRFVNQLLANGYSFDTNNPVGVDCHHETAIRRPGRPAIEIHRSIGMGRARRLLPAAEIIRNSVPIRDKELLLRLPSLEHTIAHQVFHAQLNHSYTKAIWPDLREAFDWLVLTKRMNESAQVSRVTQELSGREGARLVNLHMLTINDLLGNIIPRPRVAFLSLINIAWLHRRLLHAVPVLRFFDPYFLLRSTLIPRLQRLNNLSRHADGVAYLLRAPWRSSFYKNLIRDLL